MSAETCVCDSQWIASGGGCMCWPQTTEHTPTPAHQPGMTGGSMSMSCPKCGSETPIGHRCIVDELEAIRNMEPNPEVLRLLGGPPAPEATDPTPGEVGLSEAEVQFIYDWAPGHPDGRKRMAADVERILAARTADLRAERDRARLSRDATKAAMVRQVRARKAAEAREAELRATVERVEALAEAADAHTAEANATYDPLLRRYSSVRSIVMTDDLRAALTTPPTTEGGK